MSHCYQSMFVALKREELQESEMSTVFLVGANSKPGFLQLAGLKKSIMDFMFGAVQQAVDHRELQKSSEAIVRDVFPKFSSPIATHVAFLRSGSQVADVAHASSGEDPSIAADASPFERWLEVLEDKGAKAAAQLFMDISTGVHDEDRADHSTKRVKANMFWAPIPPALPPFSPISPTPCHCSQQHDHTPSHFTPLTPPLPQPPITPNSPPSSPPHHPSL